jgi:hypothetical protein
MEVTDMTNKTNKTDRASNHPLAALIGMPVKDVLGALAPDDGPNGASLFFPVISKGEDKDGNAKPVNIGVGFAGPVRGQSAQWPYTVLWASGKTVTDADRAYFAEHALLRAQAKADSAERGALAAAERAAKESARKAASLARLRKAAGITS